MFVERLTLKRFRNYDSGIIDLPSKGVNIFYGLNAQGKTNLIEAVYFCCVGRSPRTPRDKELIKWECPDAYIRLDAVKQSGKTRVEAYLTKTENKRISINGLPIARMGELMGAVNAVFFSPDELKIVKESPSDRRRFLDIDISQLSKNYFYNLNRYNKILSQRNRLLKTGKDLHETLPVWDLQLAATGAKIALNRKNFIDKLKVFAKNAHAYLSDGLETLETSYDGIKGETEEELNNALLKEFEQSRNKDIMHGYTSCGIHKDDIALKVNGVDIRSFGSQGQQRTTALSLKLAELEIFAEEIGEYPVLILDDVMSELDAVRRNKLLSRLSNIQTLITCTDAEFDLPNAAHFRIQNGTITPKE